MRRGWRLADLASRVQYSWWVVVEYLTVIMLRDLAWRIGAKTVVLSVKAPCPNGAVW